MEIPFRFMSLRVHHRIIAIDHYDQSIGIGIEMQMLDDRWQHL